VFLVGQSNALVGVAVVQLLCVTTVSAQSQARATAATDLSTSLEMIARTAGPAVVEIFTTSYAANDARTATADSLITTQRASGSGVIVDASGYIVTNAHVVRGAQRLRVDIPVVATGQSILGARSRTVSAEILGIDAETDLAVIKIDDTKLPALAFGDSDELKAGQLVLALGSPLGLRNSLSLGVVSAVARQLEPESPMIYVQTDASINPGSSGGPLVDLRGRVVGINTLIASQSGGNEGVAFAAPSNIVRTVYEQIRKFGRVRRGDIGVRAQTITPALATGLRLPRDTGVILADVTPASPAARAGLRVGDLVLAMDGKAMENGRQLHVNLYRRVVGDVVTLDILRDGEPLKVPVAMTERAGLLADASAVDPRQNLVSRLGILGLDLDERLAEALPAARVNSGVVVASTVSDAIDSREGRLAAGDIIFAVNRQPVAKVAELRAAVDGLKSGDPIVLQIERRGDLMYLAFTIE
jgi:serine protease Do